MSHTPKDDFENPKIEAGHILREHVLYRISKVQVNQLKNSIL